MKKEKYTAKVFSYEMPAGLLTFPKDVKMPSRYSVLNDPETTERPSSSSTAAYDNFWPYIRYEVPVRQDPLSLYNKKNPNVSYFAIGDDYWSLATGDFIPVYPFNVDWYMDVRSNEQTYVHMKAKAIALARILIHGGFTKDESYLSQPQFNLKVPQRIRDATEVKPGSKYREYTAMTKTIKIPQTKKIYHLTYGPYLVVIDAAITGQYFTYEGRSFIESRLMNGYVQLKIFNRYTGDVLYEPEPACFDFEGVGYGAITLSHYRPGMSQRGSRYRDYRNTPGAPELLGLISLKSMIIPGNDNPLLVWLATNDVIMQHSFLTFENRNWNCYFINGNYTHQKFAGITRFIIYKDPNGDNWRMEKFLKKVTFSSLSYTNFDDYKVYDDPSGKHFAKIYPFPSFNKAQKVLLVPVIFNNEHRYPEFYHVEHKKEGYTPDPVGIFKADGMYYLFIHQHLAIRMDPDYIPGDELVEDDSDDGSWEFVGSSNLDTISGVSSDATYIRLVLRSGKVEKKYTVSVTSFNTSQPVTVDFNNRTYTFTMSSDSITLIDKDWRIDEWSVWQLVSYTDYSSEEVTDKSGLQAYIDYVEENIKTEDHYKPYYYNLCINALNDAKSVINNDAATQSEIISAYDRLKYSYETLYDISDIIAAIAERSTYNSADYSKYSFSQYDTACNEAQSLLDDETALIDAEDLDAINVAKDGLVYIKELLDKISYYDSLGLVADTYTPTSWAKYENALTTAKNLANSTDNYTNDTVLEVINTLDSAYGLLEEFTGPTYDYHYVSSTNFWNKDNINILIPSDGSRFSIEKHRAQGAAIYDNWFYRLFIWYMDTELNENPPENNPLQPEREPDEVYSFWSYRSNFGSYGFLWPDSLYGYGQKLGDYYWDGYNGYSHHWEQISFSVDNRYLCNQIYFTQKPDPELAGKYLYCELLTSRIIAYCTANNTSYKKNTSYTLTPTGSNDRIRSNGLLMRVYFWINRASTGGSLGRKGSDFHVDFLTPSSGSIDNAVIDLFNSNQFEILGVYGKNAQYFEQTFSEFKIRLDYSNSVAQGVTVKEFQWKFKDPFRFDACIVSIAKPLY